jgi:hypothetical protein
VTYTQISWVVFGGGLLGVELVAIARGDPPLTDAMRAGSARWSLWPALFGTMCGHFFGSRGGPAWGPWVLLGLGVLLLAKDLFLWQRIPQATQLEWCLLFIGLGAWLWGAR